MKMVRVVLLCLLIIISLSTASLADNFVLTVSAQNVAHEPDTSYSNDGQGVHITVGVSATYTCHNISGVARTAFLRWDPYVGLWWTDDTTQVFFGLGEDAQAYPMLANGMWSLNASYSDTGLVYNGYYHAIVGAALNEDKTGMVVEQDLPFVLVHVAYLV